MAAHGSSLLTLAGGVKAAYGNLPLPAQVVEALAVDFLLARLRPPAAEWPPVRPRAAVAG